MPRKTKAANANGAPPKDAPKPAAKKTARKRAPARQPVAGAKKSSVTDEDIRIRAFFISQERHRQHLAGDANADWIEARRQLLAETAS